MSLLIGTRPAIVNRHAGKALSVVEWNAGGGWASAWSPGWEAYERFGGRSVRSVDRADAVKQLKEWRRA